MYKITISGNPSAAIDWAMDNLVDQEWDLYINPSQGIVSPTYVFSFANLNSASMFALRWKGI